MTENGSPTAAVAEEKLGSFMVHFRRVPAGKTVSRALAQRVKARRDTARTANELVSFRYLGLTPGMFTAYSKQLL